RGGRGLVGRGGGGGFAGGSAGRLPGPASRPGRGLARLDELPGLGLDLGFEAGRDRAPSSGGGLGPPSCKRCTTGVARLVPVAVMPAALATDDHVLGGLA